MDKTQAGYWYWLGAAVGAASVYLVVVLSWFLVDVLYYSLF